MTNVRKHPAQPFRFYRVCRQCNWRIKSRPADVPWFAKDKQGHCLCPSCRTVLDEEPLRGGVR